MAMTAGSVTINPTTEVATGSGLALALYNVRFLRVEETLPTVPSVGATANPYSSARPATQADVDLIKEARLRTLTDEAERATDMAVALVPYLQSNAQAKVATTDLGLQRMPASTAENTECKAPATDKFLAIV